MSMWEFAIDVGGTFTDCVATSPDGTVHTCKVLSSARTKGVVHSIKSENSFVDPNRSKNSNHFWAGYNIQFFDTSQKTIGHAVVTSFDAESGKLSFEAEDDFVIRANDRYELFSKEEAPLLAIRTILGLRLNEPIPKSEVKLGTTKGTNSLLTRTGARTAFVTTKGFADVLKIANQDRPDLFDLDIKKPKPLYERVVEIDERLDANGRVLTAPSSAIIRTQLEELMETEIESIAICLLHAFENSAHEELIEQIARDVGFKEISRSSKLSPLIKIVSRGDTTVLDAYLNPVLRTYVDSIQKKLGESRLRMMTSAGGLIDAEKFVGKDSILSGPAGGVIGYAKVGQQVGFKSAIGFDMGGTSTDVSRFDGTFDYEYETQKAGVRVVSPMLAIETVAAGGGSVCGFNGVKLFVGPDSAGANPGPACYGRGGPLTVTDMNLFLGRVPQSRFPFPLDIHAVKEKLTLLCDEISQSPMGSNYSPGELAEGFLEIANMNMVRAIRKISVSKGFDPADSVLVSFGGAGSQHACAIAKTLKINDILIHPYSGVLSAYGIGQADIRRFSELSILKPFHESFQKSLSQIFEKLAAQARQEIADENVPGLAIQPPIFSLDMRYQGEESTINIVQPTDGDFLREYESQHKKIFGYFHENHPVEVTVARVEVVGKTKSNSELPQKTVERIPEPSEFQDVVFEGAKHSVGLFDRKGFQPGDQFIGPAILCEPTSTVVVEPCFKASILERGEILIQKGLLEENSTKRIDSKNADPIQLEIFNNLFASIAEQMGVTLQKTSFSTNVKERLDFSCAIFSPTGDLVVNAPHIPVHLGAMGETVKSILKSFPEIALGDVFVTNDPYAGGSHLPDVTVITPVHEEGSGELLFLTASRSHHAEIGGIVPGSMPPFSKNLAEEGVLIRHFKLVSNGVSKENELKELLLSSPYPTRSVQDNLADVRAQVAANQSGVTQLLELTKKYSREVVQAYMNFIQQAAAAKMRLALKEKPDGIYKMTDHLDDGTPISVSIKIKDDNAIVDFTRTGPVSKSNLNANRAITTAAVMYVFRCMINEDIPLNGGVLEPIDLIIPEGLLNPLSHPDPKNCPAIVGGNVETSQRIVDVLLGALGLAAASQGTMNNLSFGNDTFGYYETICGGSGATPTSNGASAVHTHMTNTRLTDAEIFERRYPVRLHEFSIRQNSGGKGQHTGGDGIIRKIEILEPLQLSILSERRSDYPAFGLNGGGSGSLGENFLQRAGSDKLEKLNGKVQLKLNPGDIITLKTPGGGGYG